MAIHTILKMGDPRLLQTSKPIDISQIPSSEIQSLIEDMLETMYSAN